MKRRIWSGILLLGAFGIALVPLNLYILRLPEAATLLPALGLTALNVLLWRGPGGKRGAKLALSAFSLAAAALSIFGAYCNPYWNSVTFRDEPLTLRDDALVLSGREAVKELDYAMRYLEKLHPDCMGGAPRETDAQYRDARRRLAAAETVDPIALTRAVESVFSTLGDAHTFAAAEYGEPHPLGDAQARKRAGEHIAAVNGVSLDELLRQNAQLFSYETEAFGKLWVENRLSTLEGLAYLGIDVGDGLVYTWARPDGTEETCRYVRGDFAAGEDAQDDEPYFSWEIDDARDLAFLRLDRCVYNEAYRAGLREFFEAVKMGGIRNVAVDLRQNGGGNSRVANEFIRYLDVGRYRSFGSAWRLGPFFPAWEGAEARNDRIAELTFTGNVYVLTATYTFSSAMDFAMLLADNGLAEVIGEAPGNLPDGCGDIAMFRLPRSGVYFQISTKRFSRIDESKTGRPLEPDVPCAAAAAVETLYKRIAERR